MWTFLKCSHRPYKHRISRPAVSRYPVADMVHLVHILQPLSLESTPAWFQMPILTLLCQRAHVAICLAGQKCWGFDTSLEQSSTNDRWELVHENLACSTCVGSLWGEFETGSQSFPRGIGLQLPQQWPGSYILCHASSPFWLIPLLPLSPFTSQISCLYLISCFSVGFWGNQNEDNVQ